MAEIRRFEDRIDEIETIAANPSTYIKAITAARYFARALDALQVEFEPDVNDGQAHDLYYSLVRAYLLESADDIEVFTDDDGIAD